LLQQNVASGQYNIGHFAIARLQDPGDRQAVKNRQPVALWSFAATGSDEVQVIFRVIG
jgi:hypothetical protein